MKLPPRLHARLLSSSSSSSSLLKFEDEDDDEDDTASDSGVTLRAPILRPQLSARRDVCIRDNPC